MAGYTYSFSNTNAVGPLQPVDVRDYMARLFELVLRLENTPGIVRMCDELERLRAPLLEICSSGMPELEKRQAIRALLELG